MHKYLSYFVSPQTDRLPSLVVPVCDAQVSGSCHRHEARVYVTCRVRGLFPSH